MPLDIWLTFVAASIVLLLIPGPTILLVLSYAISKGRGVAVASAGGVALGHLVAMSASLAGLGALAMTSATLFMVLKWLGAAYLVWLGFRLLRSAPSTGLQHIAADRDVSARGVFGHAALVTTLNPKGIAFFVAIVPQFLRPELALSAQFAILIITFVGLAAANALAYALLVDRLRCWIDRPGFTTGLTRVGGMILIGMGIATAILRLPA